MKLNMIKLGIVGILLFSPARLCFSQGFINLDFESARIIPLTVGADDPPYSVATTNALPGWAVFINGSQLSQITYNDPAIGSPFVTLWATNGQQISGKYS